MIFYFTGTGNSKFIAERIAKATNERIINIADCMEEKQFLFKLKKGEAVGFVTPVYFYGVPIIVCDFLSKVDIASDNEIYSYAVLNCGGTTANAKKYLENEIKFDAVFGVVTVDNYVPMYSLMSEAEANKSLNKAEKEIDIIIKHIKNRDKGDYNKYKGPFARLLTSIAYPFYKNGRKTKKFTVNEKCNSCGLCKRICPRSVIQIKDEKPIWVKSQCEECFACLHRCPKRAINYGKRSDKNGRYVNKRVNLD